MRYIAAKGGEMPVFTSARNIGDWKLADAATPGLPAAAKGKLHVADVPKGWRFHNLYVNGQPQQVARSPNADVKSWRSWPHFLAGQRPTHP